MHLRRCRRTIDGTGLIAPADPLQGPRLHTGTGAMTVRAIHRFDEGGRRVRRPRTWLHGAGKGECRKDQEGRHATSHQTALPVRQPPSAAGAPRQGDTGGYRRSEIANAGMINDKSFHPALRRGSHDASPGRQCLIRGRVGRREPERRGPPAVHASDSPQRGVAGLLEHGCRRWAGSA